MRPRETYKLDLLDITGKRFCIAEGIVKKNSVPIPVRLSTYISI